MCNEPVEFSPADPGEIRDDREILPALFLAHCTKLEGQREQLMHEHWPTSRLRLHRLHPVLFRQFYEGNSLEGNLRIFTEEGHLRPLAGPAPGAAETLEKRRDSGRGVGLQHKIEIPDINTEFER